MIDSDFSAPIDADDAFSVLSWGDGANGQLGHGACSSEAAPRVVKALLGKRARLAACGAAHSAVLCASGDAYLFGRNGDGELPSPATTCCSPVCVGGRHPYPCVRGCSPTCHPG